MRSQKLQSAKKDSDTFKSYTYSTYAVISRLSTIYVTHNDLPITVF